MKRNYWPLLFIAIFTFTIYMVFWTVYNAIQTPVQQDDSFLNSYQNVDGNFNEIALSNEQFLEKYDFELLINNHTFELSFQDIYYSQKVIETKSEHKNALNVENNTISVSIKEKKSNEPISNALISMRVMAPTNNNHDTDLEDFNYSNNMYSSEFPLPNKGNFNITGVITIDDQKAYIFIKTNAL
ncbi:MAG: hypothetical protein WC141_02700 [Arcobacteraceae bacterium]